MVISKKSHGDFRISATIGIDYGKVLKMPLKGLDEQIAYTWYGNPLQEAKRIAESGKREIIYIKEVIWNNLRVENQRLFKKNNEQDDTYQGNIINVIMNNWVVSEN